MTANVSMASCTDTQPPVWFVKEMEKMTDVIQKMFAARLNQVDASIEKLQGGVQSNTKEWPNWSKSAQSCSRWLRAYTRTTMSWLRSTAGLRLNSERNSMTRRTARGGKI